MSFTIPRGVSRSYTVNVLGDGLPVSLAGARVYFTVRVADLVILQLANTAGGGGDAQIEVTDAAAGVCKVKLTHALTDREPCVGVCDLFVVTAGGDYLQPVANQLFQITQAQTRAFPVP